MEGIGGGRSAAIGLVIALAGGIGAGCAGVKAHQKGVEDLSQGNLDQAVLDLRRAQRADPRNVEFRSDLRRAELDASKHHLDAGDGYLDKGQFDAAVLEYQLALAADPDSEETATDRLREASKRRDTAVALQEAHSRETAGDKDGAVESARRALSFDPRNADARALVERLTPAGNGPLDGLKLPDKPFTLKFSNTRLREAFDVFSQMSGVNFVVDDAVKDEPVTLFVQDVPFAAALNLLLTRNQLAAKVLSSDSVLVFPDTREKRKQYRDLQVETFYLTTMPAADALNLLRSVLDVKGGYVNEALNALVIRDTPEALAVIRKILAANDLEQPEVLLDVEMIEIDRQKLLNLGVSLGSYQIGGSVAADPTNTATALTLDTLTHSFSARNVLVTLPSAVLSLVQQDTDAKLLANPEVRAVNGQQAVVHIGERVPFVTVTTLNTVTSENIQWQDVGIKLTVTPDIHRDEDVTLKLGIEASSLGPSTTTASGNTVFRIGTRTATTVLTLHDGQTQVLGGLVQDEDRTTLSKIPGLGDIPILGALFTAHNHSRVVTDVLLSITPHLVRMPPEEGAVETVWAGQEEDVHPLRSGGGSASAPPAPQPAGTPAGEFAIAAPASVHEGDTVSFTVTGTAAGRFDLTLRYDATVLTFDSMSAAGHPVQANDDPTGGAVRWSAPAGALPVVATFRTVAPGATSVSLTANPIAAPGAPPPRTTRGESTVLVEP